MQNTKVTISVEGLGEQTVFIPYNDAVQLYALAGRKIMSQLLNANKTLKPKPIITEKEIPKPKNPKDEETIIVRSFFDDPDFECKPKQLEKNEVKLEEFNNAQFIVAPFESEEFTRPKLVMAKCPHCGTVTSKMKILGEDTDMECHFCRQHYEIEKVIFTDAKCPNCFKPVYFYAANGLTEYYCKECDSPVDIIYPKDGKKAMSANLFHGSI